MNATPASSYTAVHFDHVSFAYPAKGSQNKPHIALRDISFDIHKGEYVCLLGSNGSGKSTVAQLINGLLLPTKGNVVTCGFNTRNFDHIYDIRSKAAMVFQNPQDQLVADICVDEVAFGPENLCLAHDAILERTDTALAQVDLASLAHSNPSKLSGGQQQRISLAGSLAMAPDVLILDEPTAMLDAYHKKSITALIQQLHAQGFTIIHITHDMDDVLQAQRVLAFRQSRLIFDTTPQKLFEDPEAVKNLGLCLPASMQLKYLLDHPQPATTHTLTPQTKDSPAVLEFKHVSYSYKAPSRSSKFTRLFKNTFATANKSYPWAIQDASFSIEAGSFTALIGQSGSGKSTTLSLSCGLITPTHGEIFFNGKPLATVLAHDNLFNTIGYVAQSAEHQLFAQTVYDDVAFGPRNQGLPEKSVEQRVQLSMKLVGLDLSKLATTSPFSLSGGQQKLVALAGVLSMDPTVLILDEPLAGLDPAGRRHILNVLSDLNKRGTTIVLVTHSIDDAAAYSNHILALDQGSVLASCPTDEFFSNQNYLKQLNFDYPSPMLLAQSLHAQGHIIDQNPLTLEALARSILNASTATRKA